MARIIPADITRLALVGDQILRSIHSIREKFRYQAGRSIT